MQEKIKEWREKMQFANVCISKNNPPQVDPQALTRRQDPRRTAQRPTSTCRAPRQRQQFTLRAAAHPTAAAIFCMTRPPHAPGCSALNKRHPTRHAFAQTERRQPHQSIQQHGKPRVGGSHRLEKHSIHNRQFQVRMDNNCRMAHLHPRSPSPPRARIDHHQLKGFYGVLFKNTLDSICTHL